MDKNKLKKVALDKQKILSYEYLNNILFVKDKKTKKVFAMFPFLHDFKLDDDSCFHKNWNEYCILLDGLDSMTWFPSKFFISQMEYAEYNEYAEYFESLVQLGAISPNTFIMNNLTERV